MCRLGDKISYTEVHRSFILTEGCCKHLTDLLTDIKKDVFHVWDLLHARGRGLTFEINLHGRSRNHLLPRLDQMSCSQHMDKLQFAPRHGLKAHNPSMLLTKWAEERCRRASLPSSHASDGSLRLLKHVCFMRERARATLGPALTCRACIRRSCVPQWWHANEGYRNLLGLSWVVVI